MRRLLIVLRYPISIGRDARRDVPASCRPNDCENGLHLITTKWRVIRAGSGSMTATVRLTRSDRVATLEEAKAQFQKSWDAWKAWAKLEEVV